MGKIIGTPTIIPTTSLKKNISLRTSKGELTTNRPSRDLRGRLKKDWNTGGGRRKNTRGHNDTLPPSLFSSGRREEWGTTRPDPKSLRPQFFLLRNEIVYPVVALNSALGFIQPLPRKKAQPFIMSKI